MATLFLIPAPLGDLPPDNWVIPAQRERIRHLTRFVVEASKTARKHLKQLELDTPLQVLELAELNEHTAEAELEALLAPLLAGHDVGLLSEAGCPAVADPGANLVRLAHRYGITVEPLVGPSSILLALMGSGSQGQRFAFNGYLPVPEAERIAAIRRLEKHSRDEDSAELFIETPYRNPQLLDTLRATLAPSTWLTVACDLTLPTQSIISRPVVDWRGDSADYKKRPAIFVLHASRR
ncbi:SAM-dependent methyltransferase [Laribacter hongkongensis]|uniref:SAM-dependent methyltransferase n=1 Tax=Laribacter hongkongensis TaxID=168471 RepID=UPI001EFD15B5|nr:SAM-dependent methyltransferase [Laribacter hongkongensis]MCG9077875.1 SAM-dependent methyltransferase [Laribacter hongkongensis]